MQKSRLEKGGFPLEGINLALCENPLPPLDETIEAAKKALPFCNHYTEPYSKNLKDAISKYTKIPSENIHLNAGSELILRQLFSIYGKKVHLITPTYYLFEEIAEKKTVTVLNESQDFLFDIKKLEIPDDATLVAIVNPNNPTGTVFDIMENIGIIEDHPNTMFLIDEAFIEFAGKPATDLIFNHKNVVITRTFSKGFSLAGCRVGYAISNRELIEHLNSHNDAYPLSRTAEAASLASLNNVAKIRYRVNMLKTMANKMSTSLQKIGFKTYPTETYFFLAKIPYSITADEFSKRLEKEKIHIKPLHLEGLENKFVRFATSTEENNRIILDCLEKIF